MNTFLGVFLKDFIETLSKCKNCKISGAFFPDDLLMVTFTQRASKAVKNKSETIKSKNHLPSFILVVLKFLTAVNIKL